MSLFDSNCKNVRPNCKNKCEGCACDVIKKLSPGSLVNIVLKGGDEFFDGPLAFARFDHITCCVTFILDGYPLIVDCENITAIQVLNR